MTHLITWLMGAEAAELRKVRGPLYVVHAEVRAGFWELDADDWDHAHRLAETWLRDHGAISARAHHVDRNGALFSPGPIMDFRTVEETDDD